MRIVAHRPRLAGSPPTAGGGDQHVVEARFERVHRKDVPRFAASRNSAFAPSPCMAKSARVNAGRLDNGRVELACVPELPLQRFRGRPLTGMVPPTRNPTRVADLSGLRHVVGGEEDRLSARRATAR